MFSIERLLVLEKFSSFVRQLNMYGFHKINRVSRHLFMTSCFNKKNRRHVLSVLPPMPKPGNSRTTSSCELDQIFSKK